MRDVYLTPAGRKRLAERINATRAAYLARSAENPDALQSGDSSGWHDNFAFEENMRQMHQLARQVRDLVEAGPEARVLTRTGGRTVTRPLRMGSTLGADVAQVGGSPRGDRPGIASAVGGVDQYGSAFAIVVVQLLEDGPRLASEGHLAFATANLKSRFEVDERHGGEDGHLGHVVHSQMVRTERQRRKQPPWTPQT